MKYLDQKILQEYYIKSNIEEFKTLSRAHILTVPGERLNCKFSLVSDNKQDIYLESKNEILGKVGICVKAKDLPRVELSNPENRPRLISLNVGSFGINCLKSVSKAEYEQNKFIFLEYLNKQVDKVLIVNLQDLPYEIDFFNQISELGFEVYFIPNQFSSLGKFNDRPDCGQAFLINKNLKKYDINFLNLSLSFHHGGFLNHHKSFRKYKSQDLLQKPMTLYLTLNDIVSKQIYLIANVYVSAFNNKANRFKSLKDNIKVLSQMQELLAQKSQKELIVRMVGDFNFYGYNTERGFLGTDAEPYAHLPAAFWATLSGFRPWRIFSHGELFKHGKNRLNLREVEQVREWLLENHFGLSVDAYNRLNQSKTLDLSLYSPAPLKPFFKGAGVSWILDLCVYPLWSRKFNIWYEQEPFGRVDHQTMFVQL